MKQVIQLFIALIFTNLLSADLPKIAVVDFTSEVHTQLTFGLPNQITEDLVNTGMFDVYERNKLESIMEEQGFQSSGFTDPQSSIALGKLMGIQYIVTGQISDYGQEKKTFSGYNVRSTTVYYRLKAGIRLIDVETGRILFSQSGTAEEKVVQSQNNRHSDTTMDSRLAEIVSSYLVGELAKQDVFNQNDSAAEMATVSIESTPESADVEIDGVFYGNTGTSFEIPVGLNTIQVSLPGYEIWAKKVMVKDGLKFTANLVKKVDTRIEVEVNEN